MAGEIDTFPLIRTKMQRPRLPGDLIPRRRLLDRLHAGSDRKLTLISAQAAAGKTTHLAQWLEEHPQPSAWVPPDQPDRHDQPLEHGGKGITLLPYPKEKPK
jgi:ATP/maltotriose-dependent transcriptional regulator MalT